MILVESVRPIEPGPTVTPTISFGIELIWGNYVVILEHYFKNISVIDFAEGRVSGKNPFTHGRMEWYESWNHLVSQESALSCLHIMYHYVSPHPYHQALRQRYGNTSPHPFRCIFLKKNISHRFIWLFKFATAEIHEGNWNEHGNWNSHPLDFPSDSNPSYISHRKSEYHQCASITSITRPYLISWRPSGKGILASMCLLDMVVIYPSILPLSLSLCLALFGSKLFLMEIWGNYHLCKWSHAWYGGVDLYKSYAVQSTYLKPTATLFHDCRVGKYVRVKA